MKAATKSHIDDLIGRLEECQGKDWHLDDLVNNTLGHVRKVAHLGLRGSGRRTRYFGPKSDVHGRGAAVPSPTRTPESRKRAIAALRKLLQVDA